MRIHSHTERFMQVGTLLNEKGEASRNTFVIHVTSNAEGKSLSIGDPVTGVQFSVPADLIAYWLEHGTE